MVTVVTGGMGGVVGSGTLGSAEYVTYVVAVSAVTIGGWVPEGNAIVMMSSASFRAAATIFSASAGLVII